MDDFKIVIDGKGYSYTKCDKVYVEFDSSAARSDVDCTELKNLIESWVIKMKVKELIEEHSHF
jgi:hypothetical protein